MATTHLTKRLHTVENALPLAAKTAELREIRGDARCAGNDDFGFWRTADADRRPGNRPSS